MGERGVFRGNSGKVFQGDCLSKRRNAQFRFSAGVSRRLIGFDWASAGGLDERPLSANSLFLGFSWLCPLSF